MTKLDWPSTVSTPHGSAVDTAMLSPVRSMIVHAISISSGYEAVGVSLPSRSKIGALSTKCQSCPFASVSSTSTRPGIGSSADHLTAVARMNAWPATSLRLQRDSLGQRSGMSLDARLFVEGDWIGLQRDEMIPHGATLAAFLRSIGTA
jgi:hypothetical protein